MGTARRTMALFATIFIIILIGAGIFGLLSSDVGQAGCLMVSMLILALCLGILGLFILMLFGASCSAILNT